MTGSIENRVVVLTIRGTTEGLDAAKQQLRDVGVQFEQTDRVVAAKTSTLEKYVAQVNRAYGADQAFAKGQADLAHRVQTYIDKGGDAAKASELQSLGLAGLTLRHDVARRSAEALAASVASGGTAFAAAGDKIEGLRQKLNLLTAATTGNFEGMARSGAMVANSFGLLNTAGLATFGVIGALIGVTAAVVVANLQHATSLREVEVAIKAQGEAVGVARSELEQLAQTTAATGSLSIKEVRSIEAAYIRLGVSSGPVLKGLVGITEDYAAVTGQDAVKAADDLAKKMGDPAKAARDLASTYGLLTAAQVRWISLATTEQEKEAAQLVLIDAMNQRFKGLANDGMGVVERAAKGVTQAFKDMWDSVFKVGAPDTIQQSLDLAWKELNAFTSTGSGPDEADRLRMIADIDRLTAARDRQNKVAADETATKALERQRLAAQGVIEATDPLLKKTDELIAKQKTLGAATMATDDMERLRKLNLERVTEALNTQISATDRATKIAEAEAQALRLPINQREKFLAIENLRIAQMGQELTVEEKLTAVREAGTLVSARQSADAAQGLIEMNAQATGLRRVAEAYTVSLAAGVAMEARIKAEAEARKNAAAGGAAYVAALRDEASARALLDSAKIITGMDGQVEAQKRLTQASLEGSEAVQQAARQNGVDAAFREKLAVANDNDRKGILALKATYDDLTKSILTDQQATERMTSLRAADREVTLAAAQAHAALLTDVNERQASLLAIDRQTKLNELTDKYGKDLAEIAKQMGRFDTAQALNEQTRFWNDVRGLAESTSRDISKFLVDGFVNVDKAGKSVFQNLWDGALAGAKRMIANLAAEMLRQQFIMPIVMQAIPAFAGPLGIANPQAQGAGLNPMSIVQGAQQANSAMSFFNNPLGSLSNLFSPNNFIANAFPSLFGATGGGLTAAGTGIGIGSSVAAESMLLPGAATSLAGPLAGLAPFLPALAIALPLLLSFFLSKKETVGPNANAVINFERDATGKLTNPGGLAIGGLGADNGGDTSIAKQMGDAATKGFNSVLDKFGAKLTGFPGAGDIEKTQLYYFQKTGKYGSMVGGEKEEFGSAEEAVANFIRRALTTGTITGLSDDVRLALKNTTATSIADLGKDIDFAAGFRRSVEQAAAGAGTRESQMLSFRYAAEDTGLAQRNASRDYLANSLRLFGEDSSQYRDAKTANRQQVNAAIGIGPNGENLFDLTGANKPLEGLAAAVAKMTAQFQALKQSLIDTGDTAEEAQGKIDRQTAAYIAKARTDLNKSNQQALLGAQGKGYLNDLDNLEEAHKASVANATAVGADLAKVEELYGQLRLNAFEKFTLEQLKDAEAYYLAQGLLTDGLAAQLHKLEDAAKAAEDAVKAAAAAAKLAADAAAALSAVQALGSVYADAEARRVAALISVEQARTKRLLDDNQLLIDAQTTIARTASEAATAFGGFRDSLDRFRKSLLIGDLSTLSPEQKLAEAQRQFDDVSGRAALGDKDALAQLEGISTSYLTLAKAYFASATDYAAVFNHVNDGLTRARDVASRQADIATQQLDAANRQIDILIAIRNGLGGGGTGGTVTPPPVSGSSFETLAAAVSQFGGAKRQLGMSEAEIRGTSEFAYFTAQRRDIISKITDTSYLIGALYKYYGGNSGVDPVSGDTGGQEIAARLHALGAPGYATGADFMVGGAGGPDSQLVRFRASPSERVRVTPAGAAHDSGMTAAQADRIISLLSRQLNVTVAAGEATVEGQAAIAHETRQAAHAVRAAGAKR